MNECCNYRQLKLAKELRPPSQCNVETKHKGQYYSIPHKYSKKRAKTDISSKIITQRDRQITF